MLEALEAGQDFKVGPREAPDVKQSESQDDKDMDNQDSPTSVQPLRVLFGLEQ